MANDRNWGGRRPNQTGRPKNPDGQRKQHQLRAYDDEWEMILVFASAVKHGEKEKCQEFLKSLEKM